MIEKPGRREAMPQLPGLVGCLLIAFVAVVVYIVLFGG